MSCVFVRDLAEIDRLTGRIAFVIPAYNEAPHIARLLDRCERVGPAMVVVVDDGSTDRTPEILMSRSAAYGRCNLVVLRTERNLGKQGAVRLALGRLRDEPLDGVVLLDGDGQHDPSEVPRLTSLLPAHDVVIGVRSHAEMPLERRFSNKVVNACFTAMSGVDVVDLQSGLRAYSKATADLLAERLPESGGYGLEHESLSVIAQHAAETGCPARVAATPVSCAYGEARSKMKPSDVLALVGQTVRHGWRIRCASFAATAQVAP